MTQKSVKKVFEGKLCVDNIIIAIISEDSSGDGKCGGNTVMLNLVLLYDTR